MILQGLRQVVLRCGEIFLLNNKAVLLKLLKDWQQEMEDVSTMLEHQDGEGNLSIL